MSEKRQSKDTVRHKAAVRQVKKSRESRDRERVGIRGEGEQEGFLFWKEKFRKMAEVRGAREHERIERG